MAAPKSVSQGGDHKTRVKGASKIWLLVRVASSSVGCSVFFFLTRTFFKHFLS